MTLIVVKDVVPIFSTEVFTTISSSRSTWMVIVDSVVHEDDRTLRRGKELVQEAVPRFLCVDQEDAVVHVSCRIEIRPARLDLDWCSHQCVLSSNAKCGQLDEITCEVK